MEHILLEGKKLFAAKDVAEYFKIDNSALNAWLRIHDDFRENQEYIIEMGGGKRPRRFFTELGITVYGNVKDKTYNGNRHKKEVGPTLYSPQASIAEKAHTQQRRDVLVLNDPIIAQLESLIDVRTRQLQQEQRIQEQESRLHVLESLAEVRRIEQLSAEQKLLSFPEAKKQAPQRTVRSLVVEYVNSYAQATGLAHNIVWGKIYKEYSIRTKINLNMRAKAEKLAQLEYVELNGDIEILYAIAKEIL